ncbi:uncharacterized protein LOC143851091 [Tasmannia lanceolata]|uniref:uncharacterized protein LOC143851091 n=1 Tax=Tasmannia lanceolata TaxID=3420 RepID=UPI00406306B4
MQSDGFGDQKWRDKMMEGEDGSRTIDCLRGRLLAERVTSKATKEEAELIGEKLIELERQLKIEIESRNKAEKKLKFAMKKLNSLKLSSVLGQSNLSENQGSLSSSTCSSDPQESEELKTDPQPAEPRKSKVGREMEETKEMLISKDFRLDSSTSITDDSIHQMLSYGESSSSASTAHYHNSKDLYQEEETSKFKDSLSSEELMTDPFRHSSLGGEELEQVRDQLEYLDNQLALVPASIWPDSEPREQRRNDSIHDVLVALRHAKEHLQNSLGRRAVICSRSFELCGV